LVDEKQRAERREQDAGWCRLLDEDGIEAFVHKWEKLPLFATQTRELVAAQREERLRHDPRGLSASLRLLGLGAMPRYDVGDVPVALLVGELDDKFRSLGPATIIAGAGHNPLLEQPERTAWALTRGNCS
jgi:pimeloyl-ACP methyl ester carboxylesterase